MITNIWMRILLGGHVLGIGFVLLLIHYHRHHDNIWGQFFRLGRETDREEAFDRGRAKVYFYLGCMAVAAGLMILLIGFRPAMVG